MEQAEDAVALDINAVDPVHALVGWWLVQRAAVLQASLGPEGAPLTIAEYEGSVVGVDAFAVAGEVLLLAAADLQVTTRSAGARVDTHHTAASIGTPTAVFRPPVRVGRILRIGVDCRAC